MAIPRKNYAWPEISQIMMMIGIGTPMSHKSAERMSSPVSRYDLNGERES
jgi:hypothetical protein